MEKKKIIIVGAGATGVFCALKLCKQGHEVSLYDKNPNLGVKVILASKTGLNISVDSSPTLMAEKYGKNCEIFKALIENFTPNDLKILLQKNNIEYFIGNGKKIFLKDTKELTKIKDKLFAYENFKFFPNTKLEKITHDNKLLFQNKTESFEIENFDKVILALGGSSYPKTGSDGSWVKIFQEKNIKINDFYAVNCGFNINWSEKLQTSASDLFVKNIKVKTGNLSSRKEILITKQGLQGPGIYDLSLTLQEKLRQNQKAIIEIDLLPQLELSQIREILSRRKDKESLSNFLRKSLKIDKAKFLLLMEHRLGGLKTDLAESLKTLQFECISPFAIEQAISVSGGISFAEFNENFMLHKINNFYVGGEMLDWAAPTGGYLLHGCMAVAEKIINSK